MNKTTERPHIIFIITDQQRFDTIRALGYDHIDTPNIDRLVGEGVTFTDCYITAPSCAPSRASLFTGYYPHTTGILKNADAWNHSWIEELREGGYRTINIGKMHSYPYHTPLGFEERYVVENKDRYMEERYYFDEWDKALWARGLVKQQREFTDNALTTTSPLVPSPGICQPTPTRTILSATWPRTGSGPSPKMKNDLCS